MAKHVEEAMKMFINMTVFDNEVIQMRDGGAGSA